MVRLILFSGFSAGFSLRVLVVVTLVVVDPVGLTRLAPGALTVAAAAGAPARLVPAADDPAAITPSGEVAGAFVLLGAIRIVLGIAAGLAHDGVPSSGIGSSTSA
jgi:hypothetical protein